MGNKVLIIGISSFAGASFTDYLLKNTNFKIINNVKKGLGGAINLGIQRSSGTKICIMMADLSDDINDLRKYNNLINEKNLDAVLGSRFFKNSIVKDYPLRKFLLNRIFNLIVSFIFWNK